MHKIVPLFLQVIKVEHEVHMMKKVEGTGTVFLAAAFQTKDFTYSVLLFGSVIISATYIILSLCIQLLGVCQLSYSEEIQVYVC